MVLLGIVRNHSSNFSFAWQLCRAVVTESVWKGRNSIQFQGDNSKISEQQAKETMLKAARLLKFWTRKGKEVARDLASRFYG
eukprot:c6297_g2_i1 orf=2-244(-)